MTSRQTLLLVIAVCNAIVVHPITTKKLSQEMKKMELTIEKKEHKLSKCTEYYINVYDKFRCEIDFLKLLKPNFNSDTIFVIQTRTYPCESNFYIAIWNKNHEYQFFKTEAVDSSASTYNKIAYKLMKHFQIDKKNNLFSKRIISLVNNWDTVKIEKESNGYSVFSESSDDLIAFRIIFFKKEHNIEALVFNDFSRMDMK